MTGKRVFTIDNFLSKFFANEKHKLKTIIHSKLGFATVFKKNEQLPLENERSQ
jgi:hypothetical protein